jgi:hypothetical protein
LYLANKPAADVQKDQDLFIIHVPRELAKYGYRPTEMYPNVTPSGRSTDVESRVCFGPWAPGEERWALMRYESHAYPVFHLKAKYHERGGVGLLKLCAARGILVTTLEPPGSGPDEEASDAAWQRVYT